MVPAVPFFKYKKIKNIKNIKLNTICGKTIPVSIKNISKTILGINNKVKYPE
ncbi:hypothetical protein F3D3_4749 [Fusibacter sp. 3D3]|nr:hypothetical protein F3D3_4749 [Fusibacter sp. 3D3]